MMTFSLTPGLIYIIGGLLSIGLRGVIQRALVLTVPVIAFFQLLSMQSIDSVVIEFLFSKLNLFFQKGKDLHAVHHRYHRVLL